MARAAPPEAEDRDLPRFDGNEPEGVDQPGRDRDLLLAVHRIGDDAAGEQALGVIVSDQERSLRTQTAYKYPARLRNSAVRASFPPPFLGLSLSDSQRWSVW